MKNKQATTRTVILISKWNAHCQSSFHNELSVKQTRNNWTHEWLDIYINPRKRWVTKLDLFWKSVRWYKSFATYTSRRDFNDGETSTTRYRDWRNEVGTIGVVVSYCIELLRELLEDTEDSSKLALSTESWVVLFTFGKPSWAFIFKLSFFSSYGYWLIRSFFSNC